MGLFDTIYFLENEAPTCKAGHPITALQTKDLEHTMASYFVVGGILFGFPEASKKTALGPYQDWIIEGKTLAFHNQFEAKKLAWTGSFVAYSSCDRCRPALVVQPKSLYGAVREEAPWCQFGFEFEDGSLVKTDTNRSNDTLSTIARLHQQGSLVLDEDNPVAIAHWKAKDGENQ